MIFFAIGRLKRELNLKRIFIKGIEFPFITLQMPPPKRKHEPGDEEKEATNVKYVQYSSYYQYCIKHMHNVACIRHELIGVLGHNSAQ